MFIALLEEKYTGCYCKCSIDSGKTWVKLKSFTRDAALAELCYIVTGEPWDQNDPHAGYWGEGEIGNVRLLEIKNEIHIPLTEWYTEAVQAQHERVVEKNEQIEKAEYERLKRKFEGE